MLFTFSSYRSLLDLIADQGFAIYGIEEILARRHEGFVPDGNIVAIRHDVDYFPDRALTIARIEAEAGVRTTYYVRWQFFESHHDIIRAIAALGHQIGYHYEEVDTHQKAPNMQIERDAVGFFVGALLDLDNLGFPIRTVCAHGNPLTDVDNRQVVHLVRDESVLQRLAFTYDPEIVREKVSQRLIGDASIDITGVDFDVYIPDTGRFNPRFNLKDKIDNCPLVGLRNLGDLKRILSDNAHRRVYMNMHPDRWSGSLPLWLFDLSLDTAKNIAKLILGKKTYAGRLVGDSARKQHGSQAQEKKSDGTPGSGT